MIKFLLILIFSFFINSCDILRNSPFEVVSWSPGEGYHGEPEKIEIYIIFSHEPDRDSVERRFSLTGENGKVAGYFSWENKKMFFVPVIPLEENTNYNINISAEVKNKNGLSMDSAFDANFTTRPDTERLFLVSYYPQMDAVIDDPKTEIILDFSMPIKESTLYDNVNFNPSMQGLWHLTNDDKTAVFSPVDTWQHNKRYEIRISSSLLNKNKMNLRNEFINVFFTGKDHEAPYLVQAYRITKTDEKIALIPDTKGYVYASEVLTENSGWEKDDKLHLEFSEPVYDLSVKNCVNIENSSSLVMETMLGDNFKTEITFNFSAIPVFESRFLIRIKSGIKDEAGNESENEYIYRIFADGKYSKPPEFTGIRLPMAPGSPTDIELTSYGKNSLFEIMPIKNDPENYPSGEKIITWIELYFDIVDGASIDLFSIMELFRIETTNNVLSFSPKQIKTNNFTVPEPNNGWENYSRVEINGTLTNSVNFGIINFKILSGLKDSLGNKNDKSMSITLIK